MDQTFLYWGQYFEHEVKRIQLFITSLLNKRLGKKEKIWCQLICYGTLPSVILINVLPCSAFPSFFSIIKPTLFRSTIMKQAFDSTSADIRVHDYGTWNPFLVRYNTWDQTRNWFRAKRLYGMNLSKLVELIDRAGKFSLLVLGDALVKVH